MATKRTAEAANDAVSPARPTPKPVNIKGKVYLPVAARLELFHFDHGDHSMVTEIIGINDDVVRVKATILDGDGRVRATGHAEEFRRASQINRTSAVENCETSAVGRALAFFGYAGDEIASADEVQRAISGSKGEPPLPLDNVTGPMNARQVASLTHHSIASGVPAARICARFAVESLGEIPASEYRQLIADLQDARAKRFAA
jgi:hypothetical protein